MHVSPVDPAFRIGLKAFDSVGVNIAAPVFFRTVIDCFVFVAVFFSQ